jgi:hypothetical protein
MTRPSAARIATALPPEKAPAEKAPQSPSDTPPAPTPSLAWRLTIGLWMISFAFLFVYEMLMMVVRLTTWHRE